VSNTTSHKGFFEHQNRAPERENIPSGSLLRVAGMVNDSIVDGPGLRFALFLQGCDKDCPGCHNQEARAQAGGEFLSPDAVFAKIRANPILTGVTFSGGEPLLQAAALIPLAELVRTAGLALAIYSGDRFEEILNRGAAHVLRLLSLADVLIDGPFLLSQKTLTLPFRGSANQRLLDLPRSLVAHRPIETTDDRWRGGR
jgi:anaerobic ribonucleoside-triphosphate reductase activating protein